MFLLVEPVSFRAYGSTQWSSGRGGAGNISKSKNAQKKVPVDPDARPQAKILELETARNRVSESPPLRLCIACMLTTGLCSQLQAVVEAEEIGTITF